MKFTQKEIHSFFSRFLSAFRNVNHEIGKIYFLFFFLFYTYLFLFLSKEEAFVSITLFSLSRRDIIENEHVAELSRNLTLHLHKINSSDTSDRVYFELKDNKTKLSSLSLSSLSLCSLFSSSFVRSNALNFLSFYHLRFSQFAFFIILLTADRGCRLGQTRSQYPSIRSRFIGDSGAKK